jgi:hypothetical protein
MLAAQRVKKLAGESETETTPPNLHATQSLDRTGAAEAAGGKITARFVI